MYVKTVQNQSEIQKMPSDSKQKPLKANEMLTSLENKTEIAKLLKIIYFTPICCPGTFFCNKTN